MRDIVSFLKITQKNLLGLYHCTGYLQIRTVIESCDTRYVFVHVLGIFTGITAAAAAGNVELPSSHVQTLTELWRSFPFLGYVNTAQAALNLQKELVKYLEQQGNKRRM